MNRALTFCTRNAYLEKRLEIYRNSRKFGVTKVTRSLLTFRPQNRKCMSQIDIGYLENILLVLKENKTIKEGN